MLLAAFDARRPTADLDALARSIASNEAAVLSRVTRSERSFPVPGRRPAGLVGPGWVPDGAADLADYPPWLLGPAATPQVHRAHPVLARRAVLPGTGSVPAPSSTAGRSRCTRILTPATGRAHAPANRPNRRRPRRPGRRPSPYAHRPTRSGWPVDWLAVAEVPDQRVLGVAIDVLGFGCRLGGTRPREQRSESRPVAGCGASATLLRRRGYLGECGQGMTNSSQA
jgi:hypothetical protein